MSSLILKRFIYLKLIIMFYMPKSNNTKKQLYIL